MEELQKSNFNWNLKKYQYIGKNYKIIFIVKHALKKKQRRRTYSRWRLWIYQTPTWGTTTWKPSYSLNENGLWEPNWIEGIFLYGENFFKENGVSFVLRRTHPYFVTQSIPTSSDGRSGKLERINGNVGKPPTFPINLIIIKLIYIKLIN